MTLLRQQTLALAGVIQASAMVHKLAFSESISQEDFKVSVESIFNNSLQKHDSLFTPDQVALGLKTLLIVLNSRELRREKLINRYWFALLYLASKLKSDKKMSASLREHIHLGTRQLEHFGPLHESTLFRLGDAWQQTLGTYRFKIVVVGNGPALQNSLTAAKIRTCLLAGIRAGVLWEQLGGRQWHILFRKQRIIDTAQQLLKEREQAWTTT